MNIRPNLGVEPSNLREFDEKNILKFVAKSENSDFVVKFRPRKKIRKKKQKNILGTARRDLTDLEEKFQKFVDTAENGPLQISLIFIKTYLKKKTCFSMFALITLVVNTQKFKKMGHCLAAY